MDDLLILAIGRDHSTGPGSVLAQAGPCLDPRRERQRPDRRRRVPGRRHHAVRRGRPRAVRAGTASSERRSLHEMGHVLGFGVLWGVEGLAGGPVRLPNDDRSADRFALPRRRPPSRPSTRRAGRSTPTATRCRWRTRAVAGTADVHWRESVFDNELMTGFVNLGPEPLSAITIASFAAEGYSVNPAAADPYTLAPRGGARSGRRPGIALGPRHRPDADARCSDATAGSPGRSGHEPPRPDGRRWRRSAACSPRQPAADASTALAPCRRGDRHASRRRPRGGSARRLSPRARRLPRRARR